MPIQIDLGSSSQPSPQKPKALGPVVGIDLGTTNSLIAYVTNGVSTILKNNDESSMLPSVVSYSTSGAVEDVGESAKAKKSKSRGLVLSSVKRLMGKSLKDLGKEIEQIPFELVNDELNSQVQIKLGAKTISPVEVSAEILKALKTRAEKSLGQKIDRAVVTVPAYFDDAQRTATKAAGRLAGLEVIRVFNEPTAAALAYGWSFDHPGIVAVYDLGGGTFDFSIVRIQENIYEVLSTAGDTHLGGDDFDQVLALFIFEKLSVLGIKKPWNEIKSKILFDAEALKRELTTQNKVSYAFESQTISFTREEAESLWNALVEKTLQSCALALSDAKLNVQELSDVILVGGSTRVPLVRQKVEEFFKKKPNTTLNPDEAVALGAAFQAKILEEGASDKLLLDVIPLSLGIETVGGATSKLIYRNSTIPTEAREVYTNHVENQNAFEIHILQGERELVKDCRSLAHFKLRGLSPAPAGYHRIEILFRIDANGILNVRAKDLRSGKAQEIEVKASFGISEDELLKLLEDSIDQAEPDMQKRQLVDMRVEAATVIQAAEKTLKNSGHLVEASTQSEIKARLIDLKNASNGGSTEQIRMAIQNLDAVCHELAEMQMNAAMAQALKGKEV